MFSFDPDGHVRLRPVVDEDLPILYELGGVLGSRWWRVFALARPAPQQFRHTLNYDAELVSVIEVDDRVVGCASLYDFSSKSETVWLEVVVSHETGDPERVRTDAGRQMVTLAFDNWSARKVYMTHLGTDGPPVAADLGMTREDGRLRASVLYEGAYVDRVITSIDRTTWELADSAAVGGPS